MKKIVILEDDRRIAAALVIRLEAAGYEVLTAPDGLQGLKLVLEAKPDLILMDIWMPVGLGFSVTQRLQGMGFGAHSHHLPPGEKRKGFKENRQGPGRGGFF